MTEVQRTHVVPTALMAQILAQAPLAARTDPTTARCLLRQESFVDEDIRAGLDEAMRTAGAIAAAAASDRPWAVALGLARDAAALAVIAVFCLGGWAVLS